MQEEGRVAGGDKGIRTRVSANGEMAAAVDAQLAVHIARVGLHDGLEHLDVGVLENEAGGVEERRVPGGDAGVEIPLKAAGVVVERIRDAIRIGGAVLGQGDGADVHDHVGKGASGDAAAAASGREREKSRGVEGLGEDYALVGDEVAVAAKRRVRTVKDG